MKARKVLLIKSKGFKFKHLENVIVDNFMIFIPKMQKILSFLMKK